MNEPSSLPEKGYISRRRFFVRAAALVGAPLAVIYGIPLVGTVLGPMYKKTRAVFTRIKGFRSAPVGKPVELPLPCVQTDAFMREDVVENIWVVKQAAAADSSVFSPICPHLGCRYVWNEALNKFVCPCHGSIFSIKGKVLAGPAPRPLDTLPSKVDDNGTLEVMWERYEPGTPEKKTI